MVTAIQDIKIRGYPEQMEFIQSSSYLSALIGGLRSGKTHAGAMKALAYCLANPGAWGIVTAPQNRILEIATIPKYEEIFPEEIIERKRARPHHEWKLINGCRIFFWSTEKPDTIAGASLAWGHMDEGSLSPYLAYMNIRKRLSQKGERDKSYPYQLWITTTPRQLNWLYKEIVDDEKPIEMIGTSTFNNIYFDNKAYVERLGLEGKEYEQEIEGKFVLLAGDCLFTQDALDMQLNYCEDPIEMRNDGMTSIWKEPVFGIKYVAAADCADEGGGGVNDLVIADPQTREVIAEINADIPANKFAEISYDLLKEYYNPLFAPERNGTVGGIVTQKFIDMDYPNLFKDDKDKYGWYTISTAYPPKVSKFQMLKEFEEVVRSRRWIERSSDAIGEMSTLIRDDKGIYNPRQGCRSDRVMSRAICNQMFKHDINKESVGFMVTKREVTSYR